MKKKGILPLLLVVLILGLSACSPLDVQKNLGVQQSSSEAVSRTITVNGSGTVTLLPDIATISIGVYTENADASVAMSENSEKVALVIDALEMGGVAETDISTSNISIYPQQGFDENGNPTSTVYYVQNSLTVKVRDLDAIGNLLDSAITAGANNIYGISFDLENPEPAQTQAIQKAVDNAKARADTLAQAGGATLGEVISISTYIYGNSSVAPYYDTAVAGKGGGEVPVSSGSLEITVEVNLTYAIQ
ncbi:MAG: SIMPL domain-containing protein [Anaerolineales bacterium]|nr:SIMPL domain-containing protein [Anaerolineales bacterium]